MLCEEVKRAVGISRGTCLKVAGGPLRMGVRPQSDLGEMG